MGKTWRIDSLDTLFFRDGKSFEPEETSALESLFPPSPSTIQGIIRTRILSEFTEDFNPEGELKKQLEEQIGKLGQSDDLGKLKLSGPFLAHKNQRLYPLPLDVVESGGTLVLIKPSDKITTCDLGEVRLPTISGANCDFKSLGDRKIYIAQAELEKTLLGDLPNYNELRYLYPHEKSRDGKQADKKKDENVLTDR